jgi:6-phosphogluconolactonase/glucosamine-6-phosphate isomerase/deaminase
MSIEITEVNSVDDAAKYIAGEIVSHMSGESKVLWLVPGGSAIKVAVEAAKIIAEYPHKNLSVTLTDERYGPVGHKDSNWKQLFDAGFRLPEAKLFPVLTGEDLKMTAEDFSNIISRELAFADYKIGLFGMGVDGHLAGILPKSGAVFSFGLAFGYKTAQFERITITNKVIINLDEAVLYAEGSEKEDALENLDKDLGVFFQPAQVLRKVKKFKVFYNKNKK